MSKGKKIKLIFKEIRLKPSAGCALSYVQISDGESDRYPDLGRFCRPMLPRTIISSTNKLFIGFQPDGAADAQGFVLEWESVENEDNSNTVTSFPGKTELKCSYLSHFFIKGLHSKSVYSSAYPASNTL